jgi:hypothetical protein
MESTLELACPYCFQPTELFVEPEMHGSFVQDCDVCCHPLQIRVERDEHGEPLVDVTRAQ